MKNNFDFNLNRNNTFFLISGPCVIENEELNLKTAEKLKEVTDKLKIPFIYKSSLGHLIIHLEELVIQKV